MPNATLQSVRASTQHPKLKWPNPDGVAACETNNVCKAAWDKHVGKPKATSSGARSGATGPAPKLVPANSGDLGGTAAGTGTE